MKGKELEFKEYEPLFPYLEEKMKKKGCFRILCGDYVTDDTGTGIVHTAPAFGEDDYKVCMKYKVIDPNDPCVTVDHAGNFKEEVTDFKGIYIKDADELILEKLKQEEKLITRNVYIHSYPMCWRSDTPLIYKAIKTWFIRVTDLKEKLIANNKKSYWVPQFAQHNRFANWLENCQDWCFSRNRFWGNPIPIWVSDDGEEQVCVGSVEELRKLANLPEDLKLEDLHREFVDKIEIPSKQGKGMLKRIPEVFDCWFESGSMPYAQFGYPENMS